MATYEDMLDQMSGMSEGEMNAMVEENKKICADYCGICPSYKDTGETGLMFCAMGKSDKISVDKGCICGGCPIQENLHLRWDKYCLSGSGREHSAAEK